MRPSRVVDVVRAGPSRCRASIVAIMAKVNRRAKVPEQNASRRPSRTGETPIRRRWPLAGGQDSCSYSCGRHEPIEDQDEVLDRCSRDPVHGLAALFFSGILATTSRNAGSLGGRGNPEQSSNPGVRAFFFSKRRKDKSDRDSRDPADPGIGHRMHSGGAKYCRGHRRPDEPLRPIGDAKQTPAAGNRDLRRRRPAALYAAVALASGGCASGR